MSPTFFACHRLHRIAVFASMACVALAAWPVTAKAQQALADPPINYHATRGQNPVRRLMDEWRAGRVELEYEPGFGYLRSVLEQLQVPVASQSLVFSKTSLQSRAISPQHPRAIYFGDDVYVGWVQGSPLLEISTADPKLGAAFYTLRMNPGRPVFRRENQRCLACHEESTPEGKAPLHMVRSVMTRSNGKINLLLDEYVTGHTSPLAQRWGGWYVTGDAGRAKHLGNSFLEDERMVPIGRLQRQDLRDDFQTRRWPLPHSDIVALMVLEHQTQMHNRFTRANYAVRRARHRRETGRGDRNQMDAAVAESAELIVDYLLFRDEAGLESPIRGSNAFAEDFAAGGPRDSQGRSLRDFDLETRLFRYPCSYLIYTSAFDTLEPRLLGAVYDRLLAVLTADAADDGYGHLSVGDRRAILEILRETKPGLPPAWHRKAPRKASRDAGNAAREGRGASGEAKRAAASSVETRR
jgi:hypothetical protein